MSNHLLENKPISSELILNDIKSGHLGSFVFTHHIMNLMKIAYKNQIDTMNPMDLFQDTWEIIFWFVKGSKTIEQKAFLQLINDFGSNEISFHQTLNLINDINKQ
jgi:hypothetical protein